MKIYTKAGDKGKTSLIGGARVLKSNLRVEAYGTIDELNSYIGLIRDQQISPELREKLINIQRKLFTAESLVAHDPKAKQPVLPQLKEDDVKFLEKEIDVMNESLSELSNFILPGGHTIVSYCHIARTITRRAERALIRLSETEPVNELVMKYLNRLSDYLFVLARKFSKDLEVEETPWKENP
ncbi:MAG: cob(I)yrinic acid a,c-diamide adenosyltransferase [Bacteroidales bacterium]|nr:cob(I)yrinic acid a,c-diamide adenosyltransferase [Bacteroidales bacterium]